MANFSEVCQQISFWHWPTYQQNNNGHLDRPIGGKDCVRIPGRAKNFTQVFAHFAFAIEFINRFCTSYAQKIQ